MRLTDENKQNEQPVKRGRGRPKGSKNKAPMKKSENYDGRLLRKDPKTGAIIAVQGNNANIIVRMGDEKVSAFVQYHIEMMHMRQGCNPKDVPDLYQRFYRYLAYCAEHGIVPNNMNGYFAIGVTKNQISEWHLRTHGTEEQHQFAEDVLSFFASVHEQAPTDGLMNPISAMFWQKAHDGMIEASKLEVINSDPLGDRKSAADIARQYSDVDLPD